MASTRLCGCWLRSSFSLLIQFSILFIILATTLADTDDVYSVGIMMIEEVHSVREDSKTTEYTTLTTTISVGGTTRSSDHTSIISVFVTVNSASTTPDASSQSPLPSVNTPDASSQSPLPSVNTPDASSQSPLPSVKSKKGLAIGLGLGVPALCFLIFSTVCLIFSHCRNKRASEGSNDLLIAENKSQPMKKNPESLLLHELPDNQAALSELADNREQLPLLASRTELPTNSLPLAEMCGD